jgi:hypothetical protein
MKKNLLALLVLFSVCLGKAQVGNSLNFDGSNDNIRRGVVSTLASGVTYEARVRAAAPSTGNKFIMYNGTNGTNGFGLYLQALTNTVVVKVGASVYTTSYVIPTGSFVLLSIVFTGPNALQVFANGTMVQNFFPSPATAPSGSFAIGSDDAGANFFGGDIDEIRYWNRIVCPAEIVHRSTCQAAGIEPLLVACYNFNQGVGSANNSTVLTLMDSSPNNYTATLTGFGLSGATSNWLTIAGGFSSTCTFAPATVTVSPTGTTAVCPGSAVTLSATGATSYTWSTASSGSSISVTPSVNTTYSVVGASGFCIGMGVKTVSVLPSPTLGVSSSTTNLCIGQTATLTANGASSYTWMPSGSGATIAVSPTVNTTYTVVGTGTNTCMNSAIFTQNVQACPNGLAQLSNSTQMTIYPNPTKGVFNVDLSNVTNASKLEVYNAFGQMVISNEVNSYTTKIDMDSMPKGIYIVRIKEGNTIVKTSRLIKE